MATFGKARRAQGGGSAFLRPFGFLLTVSLALLLLRDTAAVRGVSTFATEFLVPAERVLGSVGSSVSGFWQSIAEIENLRGDRRSEEHTSELQSQSNLVCRLLLEKKKKTQNRLRIIEQ